MICVPNFDFWPQRRREKETFLNAWKIMKRKLMYDLCRFSQLMLGMLLASGPEGENFWVSYS